MQNLTPIEVFSRTATFEITGGDSIYYSTALYEVFLNGQPQKSGDTNVFTLFSLQPAMLYQLAVRFANGEVLHAEFTTKPESVLLDVTRFGARGDAKTDCTGALQAALDTCPAQGTVYVPAGVYISYPLFLKSDTTLYLEKGAVLLGGLDTTRYPILPGVVTTTDEADEISYATWEGNPMDSHASLLTALDKTNVLVTGEGTIDGNAQKATWWQNPKVKQIAWRPRTIFAARCTNLTLQGVTVQNSPSWTVHPYYCENVKVLNVFISNPAVSPNTDGCNPESCNKVQILGTRISVGDDCIAIKSGKYYMSRKNWAPARAHVVRNCLLQRGHGAIVLGSEISSGLDGLVVERCLIENTDRGLRVKTRRGRGDASVLKNIEFSHVKMVNVLSAFTMNMFYNCDPDGASEYVKSKAPLPVDDKTPQICNLYCHDITCEGVQVAGVFIYALPEQPMQQLTLENVQISFAQVATPGMPVMMEDLAPVQKVALFATNLQKLQLKNVKFNGYEGEALQLQNVGEIVVD